MKSSELLEVSVDPVAPTLLSSRLRELRSSSPLGALTQKELAQVLGTTPSSISSWESGVAVPPDERLRSYARLFGTTRSRTEAGLRMVSMDDLSAAEQGEFHALHRELRELRAGAQPDREREASERGALGGRFFAYSNGLPVTILYTPFSARQMGVAVEAEGGLLKDALGRYVSREVTADDPLVVQYATNQAHPNHVSSLVNGDVDTLLELVGHIRAENPVLNVRWVDASEVLRASALSGNLVILGQGDSFGTEVLGLLLEELHSPLMIDTVEIPGYGRDFGEEFGVGFRVDQADGSQIARRPRFRSGSDETELELRNGAPVLEADLAFIMRKPNPLNAAASVTWISGGFSRGTFGGVRAFTDPLLRSRNEEFVYDKLDPNNFWILSEVTIFAGVTTLTPDLAGPNNRIATS